jgi:hypothetical protein
MNDFRRHLKPLAALGGLAAALLVGAVPAQAYKINDQLELNAKIFAKWVSGNDNTSSDGFHVDRTYVEGRGHLQDGDTIRFTLDQKTDDATGGANKVFVKYAYWQHPLGGGASIKVGQNHTPMIDYDEEHFWGRRYVAPTFIDSIGADTSSDIGVSVLGKAGDMVDYYVSAMNGEGYQHTPDGRGYSFSGRIEAHAQGFHGGFYDITETRHGGVKDYDPQRELFYAFYDSDLFRLGGEYLMADNGSGNTTFDSATGYNIQGQVKLPVADATLFARYDSLDKTKTAKTATFTVAGVEFPVAKGVVVTPNVQATDTGSNSTTLYLVSSEFKF